MEKKLNPRARKILSTLKELNGTATTRQIAEKTGFDVNGASQTLGSTLGKHIECLGGRGGEVKWKIKEGVVMEEFICRTCENFEFICSHCANDLNLSTAPASSPIGVAETRGMVCVRCHVGGELRLVPRESYVKAGGTFQRRIHSYGKL